MLKNYNFRLFSSKHLKSKVVRTYPDVMPNSKIVIPISMGRYNISAKKTKEYNETLSHVFNHAFALKCQGYLDRVDVISTAGLQKINWNSDTSDRIEKMFFEVHSEKLKLLSNAYTWDGFIESKGSSDFDKNYDIICDKSKNGSQWYDMMVNTHKSVIMSPSIEQSLEYQRREYAAVMLMHEYENLLYLGPISIAWSYMYQLIDTPLPLFTKVSVESFGENESVIKESDASHTTKIVSKMFEDRLRDKNFPKKEKQKLIDSVLSASYAYSPKRNISTLRNEKEIEGNSQDVHKRFNH